MKVAGRTKVKASRARLLKRFLQANDASHSTMVVRYYLLHSWLPVENISLVLDMSQKERCQLCASQPKGFKSISFLAQAKYGTYLKLLGGKGTIILDILFSKRVGGYNLSSGIQCHKIISKSLESNRETERRQRKDSLTVLGGKGI